METNEEKVEYILKILKTEEGKIKMTQVLIDHIRENYGNWREDPLVDPFVKIIQNKDKN